MTDERRPVIVIGGGPSGLTSALALRALRVPVLVLEADPADQTRPGSRAVFVHRESLQLLERMRPGLGAQIADRGIAWDTRRTLYRGRQVYAREYPPPAKGSLPPFASLRQLETEEFLRAACAEAQVEMVWATRIEKLRSSPDGVDIAASDGRRWTAEYVVGADGARSQVRRAIGVRMLGDRSNSYHVVVDLADDHADPPKATRTFHYHHPGLDGRHVLVVPFAGGRQVDLQCRAGDDPGTLATPAALREWLPHVVDPSYLDRVLWTARYPFLQLVADAFTDRNRRVLLVGEAAHLFAPFGARGMNSGIADADTAAAALALALSAATSARASGAIDDFARQRSQAARRNCAAAGAALAHMRPRSPLSRARQQVAAALSPVIPPCGRWLERAPYGSRTPASATGLY
jgi:3-(3-hydroxy-phenyl)propionate hydroxylase